MLGNFGVDGTQILPKSWTFNALVHLRLSGSGAYKQTELNHSIYNTVCIFQMHRNKTFFVMVNLRYLTQILLKSNNYRYELNQIV